MTRRLFAAAVDYALLLRDAIDGVAAGERYAIIFTLAIFAICRLAYAADIFFFTAPCQAFIRLLMLIRCFRYAAPQRRASAPPDAYAKAGMFAFSF